MKDLNHSRPDRKQREKSNLDFYIHIPLWWLKRFYEGYFYFNTTFWNVRTGETD